MSEQQALWTEVDAYFSGLLAPADAALEAALDASAAAGLPAIHVSPNQGKLLMLLAMAAGARNVLEVGTLGGYSTIWLARAVARGAAAGAVGGGGSRGGGAGGGGVATLEASEKHAAVARANIARAGLGGGVDVIVGRASDTLPRRAAEGRGPIDFVFIAADKISYVEYLAWAVRRARPGGLIVADNVVRKGAVVDAKSTDANVQGVRRFNEALAADRRVTATAIQTVGSKGYDGFVVAVVVGE